MSLLQALEEEQREVLQELQEQKKQKPRQPGSEQTHSARPATFRPGDGRKGAMSAVYGGGQLPNPLGPITMRRNSTPEISGIRVPLSPPSRRRPASSGSGLLRPAAATPSRMVRSRSDNALHSSNSQAKDGAHIGNDRDGGTSPDTSQASDEKNDNDDLEVEGEADVRGRGRERPKYAAPEDDRSESRSSSIQSAIRFASDSNPKYKANLSNEPTLTITGPDGEKAIHKKSGVHPSTSFDQGGGSGVSTPINSDTEADITDIRRAQRMALTVSPIHSTPEAHRVIRQIIRGQYSTFQREAEQGLRRQRVYLVATDLSEEAAYALEWTIGTVLRDGDTLLAVYAVDEETGTGGEASSVGIGEGASAIKDTASIVGSFPTGPDATTSTVGPSPLCNNGTLSPSPEASIMSKAERERYHAASEVSDRCVKLLRKTRLQVRVVVEVFHCKSPKHMITEVIDFLEPTLVILGSRGRSALKGNYLVTKSSIPVMVARKRLKKHSKYRRTNVRLSNVLINPSTTSSTRFAHAKVDEFDAVRPGSVEAERMERKKKRKEQELQEALALIPR
ncbi:MAG: hypothetical protein M1821_006266 [Bathelium mastoideum]|nr:MAG: hypothetical protein M1821_006266 [Bathelium mastoideum]